MDKKIPTLENKLCDSEEELDGLLDEALGNPPVYPYCQGIECEECALCIANTHNYRLECSLTRPSNYVPRLVRYKIITKKLALQLTLDN